MPGRSEPTTIISAMSDASSRITLHARNSATGEVTLVQVFVAENGDLVMQRRDADPAVEAAYGHEDIESTHKVKREHVARIALELIGDHFTSVAEFGAWLQAKGIPGETEIWP